MGGGSALLSDALRTVMLTVAQSILHFVDHVRVRCIQAWDILLPLSERVQAGMRYCH